MKKLNVLLVLLLAIAGTTWAQQADIYAVGSSTHSSGKQCAVVYHNSQKLYEIVPPLGDYNYESSSVVVGDGNVYWTMNSTYAANGDYNYGDVYKNGTVYLSNPGGQHIHLYDLAYGDGHIYAAGTALYNGNTHAVIFRDNNTTPYLALGHDGHISKAYCTTYVDGDLYSAGFETSGYGGYDAVIWKNSTQLYNFGVGKEIADIAFFDGNVYTVVNTNANIKVYKNNQVLYTLADNWNGNIGGMSICVDAGDIYVTGHVHSNIRVWKNGEMIINLTAYDDGNSLASVANHLGVYHAGYTEGTARVWRNDVSWYSYSDGNRINGLYVDVPCGDDGIRTLPFTDGFENNNTEWSCWTKVDSDHNNNGSAAYWHRSGVTPDAGSYCLRHGGNPNPQQGWLITPRLFLQPNRDNTTLTFRTREWSSTECYQGVLVSTNSDMNNADAYTEVWVQNHGSSIWKTVTVDLGAYQGQAIYIAFRHMSSNNMTWDIDEVSVTESWTPCGGNATVPFLVNFENGMNSCWYIIDDDHSGGNKCWQYDSSTQSMVHPWGPSGVFQKGMLFTPKINLPSGHDYVLKFFAKNQSSGTDMCNQVKIAVDESGVPDPLHYYTTLWIDQDFPGIWDEVEIPLSAYAGHVITLCFDYEGTNAHKWFIDDVRVEEVEVTQYTITASASPSSGGTVTGGGTYNEGASVTLTATPNTGYNFVNWTKNGTQVSTNATYTFTATSDGTYVANFQMTGTQLTVYPSATVINNTIPMYVYYFDDFTRAQHIMPASELTTMSGSQITAIKYYTNSTNIPYSTVSEIDFYLKEVSGTTLTNLVDKSTAQIVYHGTVDFTAAGNGGEVTINFTTPFNYNGGNLLVGCDNTTDAGYKNIWFIGETGHTNAAIYGSDNSSLSNVSQSYTDFLPKTTFYYTGGGGGAVTQTTSFTSGWNWWSSYVELDGANSLQSLESGLGTHGMTIKSQNNGYASYLAGFGWYGSLSAINNECTYQVKADAACTVSLSGNAANPASHPVTLTSGWTWVGYPVNASMSVTTALAGITPQSGDMLKSQNNGYATYLAGYGWYGSLTTLNPGMGLMYKSNNSSSVTLTYPNGGSKEDLKANQTTENNHWQPNLSAYPDNMSVMAVVELDGEELQGEHYELAAFANGEVRGSARLLYVEPLNRYIAFLTVAGDEAAELRFSLYNAETGEVETQCVASLQYETNAVVGSFDEPYVVSFRSTTGVDEQGRELCLYPNPANDAIRIAGLEANSEVLIFNSLGDLVKVATASSDSEIGIGELANGLYLIRCGNVSMRFVKTR